MPEPKLFRVAGSGGVALQGYEWPGEGRPIVLVHATGFHARCWDEVVARLPGRHVYALDMRGHGLSDKPEPPYSWRPFGEDLAAFMRAAGIKAAIGMRHSAGGHAASLAAALEPGAFAGLVLLDPVIMPRVRYAEPSPFGGDHFAARRRNAWASPAEMIASFAPRPPFSAWDPAVLRDYCTYGLLPNPAEDGYVLACPPHIEAAIYQSNSVDGDIYDEIATLEIPVRVLRARPRQESAPMDMSASPTALDLASHYPQGEDVLLPQRSHFIPMEDPALAAREVVQMAARLG